MEKEKFDQFIAEISALIVAGKHFMTLDRAFVSAWEPTAEQPDERDVLTAAQHVIAVAAEEELAKVCEELYS